ncbi:glycoside hydrolase family 95 protein [Caldicellulosiruptor morganii]|uniref:Glycoside hydrolase family 95 protein n=1 Tax=Caldicellulosiruptor morganii TaxID=1387555 RepID=A0ABY7BKK8_9FIRM|nr:glycoside hydrolase family 95 protein [Caldicellulosiruptor morganii]WAM33372.1 glycoside hydrolase family 95 protein [Caldicellulosiruptor morganii]
MNKNLKIIFNQPANSWDEALPIGNGKLGAMVYGTIRRGILQLNEDSIWSGGPMERINPDAKKYLPRIRELILKGEVKEAEKLALYALTATPPSQGHYEPLGYLYLDFSVKDDKVEKYKRELDLERAVAKVSFEIDGVKYEREYFASYPDNVIVARLKCSKEKGISFSAVLRREKEKYVDRCGHIGDDTIFIEVFNGGAQGLSFCGMVKAFSRDGKVYSIGETLFVEDATEAVLLISSATTYRHSDYFEHTIDTLMKAAQKGYDKLYKDHLADYTLLFNRVDFHLESDDKNKHDLPTPERLKRLQEGEIDLGLIPLYFQFGRYLLISSSRPGSLPANLQGIWNKDMLPPWDSKYTININTEMSYWPAEVCNLSECHLPLFDLIEKMRQRGSKTAKEMYGCRGFCAHHNTDIWGDTEPQDVYLPATHWPMGAAWLCLHIWEHYEYTGDIEFLKSHYETMKEAALFLLDYMVEDKNGYLVTCPSLSPENTYILPNGDRCSLTYGPTMDIQIITALFNKVIKASEILNLDFDFAKKLKEALAKLPPIKIGKYGQIQEWIEDYEEAEPGHRHISHLFGLYPESQITKEKTPELFEAAKKTLARRLSSGSGHTGWSRAWIICFFARLKDGEMAYKNILELLRKSTLPNLLDNHPPFQIDGNFGATAGIAEMLLQSHNGIIEILPALPPEWKNGYIKGLKARGGHTIDIEWENGELKKLAITPGFTKKVVIKYKDKLTQVDFEESKSAFVFDSSLEIIN